MLLDIAFSSLKFMEDRGKEDHLLGKEDRELGEERGYTATGPVFTIHGQS
jgi:hypothetical protein